MLEELEKIKNELIITEGKKDKRVLEEFGCRNVITLDGRALFKVVEDLPKKCKRVCILTDLDREGKKLYSKLKNLCCKNGIKVKDSFRNYLFKKSRIRQIEGLNKEVKI